MDIQTKKNRQKNDESRNCVYVDCGEILLFGALCWAIGLFFGFMVG